MAQQPAMQYVEQPMTQYVEQPMMQYVEQPMMQYVEQPMMQYVEQPMQQQVEMVPVQQQVQMVPMQQTVQAMPVQPTVQVVPQPIVQTQMVPVQQPVQVVTVPAPRPVPRPVTVTRVVSPRPVTRVVSPRPVVMVDPNDPETNAPPGYKFAGAASGLPIVLPVPMLIYTPRRAGAVCDLPGILNTLMMHMHMWQATRPRLRPGRRPGQAGRTTGVDGSTGADKHRDSGWSPSHSELKRSIWCAANASVVPQRLPRSSIKQTTQCIARLKESPPQSHCTGKGGRGRTPPLPPAPPSPHPLCAPPCLPPPSYPPSPSRSLSPFAVNSCAFATSHLFLASFRLPRNAHRKRRNQGL
jgi:hypothetical protein